MGATAVGIYDLRVTPFSGICPGVEIQATFIDNILRRHFLQASRLEPIPTLLTLLGLGLCLGLVLPLLSAAWSSVFALFLAGGYTTVNYLLFSRWGWQLELFCPLLAIAGITMSLTVQRFLAEERQRVYIKKAFQSYVAPDVVDEILKHPQLLRLGGERRELTILFSDIRGFTSLSETMEPEVLVGLLHEFLNPMSEIIVTHGGTIDKYIGDAIMALFGAPLTRPDHPVLACRTALAMMAKLKALNEEWESVGRPVMRIGLGLNSGDVAVGNMGSDRLFNYTAIGDNVNLASRLEGLNKFYGTSILISSSTAQALDGQFVLQEVDLVQVKGKAQALTIFELLGEGRARNRTWPPSWRFITRGWLFSGNAAGGKAPGPSPRPSTCILRTPPVKTTWNSPKNSASSARPRVDPGAGHGFEISLAACLRDRVLGALAAQTHLTGPGILVILEAGRRGDATLPARRDEPEMSKVIDIEDRLKLEQKKKARVDRAKKTETVRKVVQCTRCLARCARCGIQFDTSEMYKRYGGPYRLCAFCQEEYEDFLRITEKGQEEPLLLAQPGVAGPVAILDRLSEGHEGLRRIPGVHRPGAGGGIR